MNLDDSGPEPVDITACKGQECPLRERCTRYAVVRNGWSEWQTFFCKCPYETATETCPYFREI